MPAMPTPIACGAIYCVECVPAGGGQTLACFGAGRSTINRRTSARRTVTGTPRRTVTRTTVSAPPVLGDRISILLRRNSRAGFLSRRVQPSPGRRPVPGDIGCPDERSPGPAGLVGLRTRTPRRAISPDVGRKPAQPGAPPVGGAPVFQPWLMLGAGRCKRQWPWKTSS